MSLDVEADRERTELHGIPLAVAYKAFKSTDPRLTRESPRPRIIDRWRDPGASWRCPGGPAPDGPDPGNRRAAGRLAPDPAHRLPARSHGAPFLRTPSMPDRYYLTTSIAYANSRPGIHTLYEVIGSDVGRPLVPDEGRRPFPIPDRYRRALDQHRPVRDRRGPVGRRDFLDDRVAEFKAAEDALSISARPVHSTTTDPDHIRGRAGDGPPGPCERRHLPREHQRAGTARTRASATRRDVQETVRGTICPNHPDVPLQWLTEKNSFSRLSAYRSGSSATSPTTPSSSSPTSGATRCSASSAAGSRTSRSAASGRPATGASRSRSPRTARRRQREDGSWDPEAGTIYVSFDALLTYFTGIGYKDEGRSSSSGGRPRSTSSARTSRATSLGPLAGDAAGPPAWSGRGTSGSTAGCSRPAASG